MPTTAVILDLVGHGEVVAALDLDHGLVGGPVLLVHDELVTHTSKLAFVMERARMGWTPFAAGNDAEAFVLGGDLAYDNDFKRPRAYFDCLVSASSLLDKGVPRVPHRVTDQCPH